MPKADAAALQKQLREAREGAGVTQVDLAARLGKPQSFVSKYENGERELGVLELIEVLEALQVDVLKFVRGLL